MFLSRVFPFSFQNDKLTQTWTFEPLLMYLKPLVIQAFRCWRSHPDGNKTSDHYYPPQVSWDKTETFNPTHNLTPSLAVKLRGENPGLDGWGWWSPARPSTGLLRPLSAAWHGHFPQKRDSVPSDCTRKTARHKNSDSYVVMN